MEVNVDEPKVSVIVLTYNQEKTIGRTLDSILRQKRNFPIEIIIGDDASKDHTVQVCREYARKYPEIIRLVENKTNKGLLQNYYDCVLLAKGKYISECAGDDFWIYEEKIQKQSEILDRDKDTVLVCADWKNYIEEKKEFESPWQDGKYPYIDSLQSKDLTTLLLRHPNPPMVHLCTAMYRKDAFLKLFHEDPYVFTCKEFIVEDLQLITLLSCEGKFQYLDVPVLAYSVSDKSLTGTKDFNKVFDLYYASLSLTRCLADKTGVSHEALEDYYKKFIHYITAQAFHSGDKGRLSKARRMAKDWNLSLNKKTKLIFLLAWNKVAWEIARKTKR